MNEMFGFWDTDFHQALIDACLTRSSFFGDQAVLEDIKTKIYKFTKQNKTNNLHTIADSSEYREVENSEVYT